MEGTLRKATLLDAPVIWEILQQAIERRRLDGSLQWQDGYPNLDVVKADIDRGYGFVFERNQQMMAYMAIIFDGEPAYENLDGEWLSNGDYVAVHRVATAEAALGKGLATKLFKLIETLAMDAGVYSIKVDTNFDNLPMLRILEKLEYCYCGEVFFRGSSRKAYEKQLPVNS